MNLRDNIIFKDSCLNPEMEYSAYWCNRCHPWVASDRAKDIEFRYALNKVRGTPYATTPNMHSVSKQEYRQLPSAVKSAMNYYSSSGVSLFGDSQCDGCNTLIYKLIMNHMTAFIKLGLIR
jgi:hypothetical protein